MQAMCVVHTTIRFGAKPTMTTSAGYSSKYSALVVVVGLAPNRILVLYVRTSRLFFLMCLGTVIRSLELLKVAVS